MNIFLNKKKSNIRRGFTLAEVLITLGIIGVVASLIMPSVIQNHRKKVLTTRIQKFHTTINQAIKMAEVKHGDAAKWVYPDTVYNAAQVRTWVETYLQSEMKIVKMENDPNGSGNSLLGIYFPDGSKAIIFSHNTPSLPIFHIYFFPDAKKKYVIPESGTVFFSFFLDARTNSYVKSYDSGWDGTREQLIGSNPSACNASNGGIKHYCTKLLELNNWQVPDDYPLPL